MVGKYLTKKKKKSKAVQLLKARALRWESVIIFASCEYKQERKCKMKRWLWLKQKEFEGKIHKMRTKTSKMKRWILAGKWKYLHVQKRRRCIQMFSMLKLISSIFFVFNKPWRSVTHFILKSNVLLDISFTYIPY